MTFLHQTYPFVWSRYSKKLVQRIESPYSIGVFTPEEAKQRDLHLALGKEGHIEEGSAVCLYWLVDKTDGIIVDARFQVFGQSALIGALEAACELLVGKNYDQARRLSADLIDRQVRDRGESSAFPEEMYAHLNQVIDVIDQTALCCMDIPLPQSYVAPPTPLDLNSLPQGEEYPGWRELTLKQKLAVIEQVLDQEIRPYIALDAGGVEVLNLINDQEVIISYQGSCTSCISSTGATLSAIQQILRAKISKDLIVVPNFD